MLACAVEDKATLKVLSTEEGLRGTVVAEEDEEEVFFVLRQAPIVEEEEEERGF